MPAESELYSKLSGAAPVTAIVGANIFSDISDEETDAPYIFFERSGTEMVNTIHTGIPAAEFPEFIVVCFADTREAAEDLADKAITATATDSNFLVTGRQGEYDAETRLYATTIQLQHFD